MKKYRKFYVIFLSGMLLCLGGCGRKADRMGDSAVHSMDTAMGTMVQQTIYLQDTQEKADQADGEGQSQSGAVTDDVMEVIRRLEEELLSWRLETSEVYAINESAGDPEGILVSPQMKQLLTRCREVSEASSGAFDITMGRVVRLWNLDAWAGADNQLDYRLPGEEEILSCLSGTGYEKLDLQENRLYLPSDLQLDLGAVGKGIALDEIQETFSQKQEVAGAIVSVGGSVLTYGTKPDGTSWRVAVTDPQNTAAGIGYLELSGQWCVSTSGTYERFVEVNGVRYHHIIDPSTGHPADSGLDSVTVLTKDGFLSDALSTACLVLGKEEGGRLAQAFQAEAIFVDHEGNVTMTEGMGQYFHLSKVEK